MKILSFGGGVQSTAIALMAAAGEIGPMPDAAIFADTQWEPSHLYEHLDWIEPLLPFPLYRVTAGSLRENLLAGMEGKRFAAVPFFTETGGMGRRQCTREFKIEPVTQKIRQLLGLKKGEKISKNISVETWIGISTDEAHRMKPSGFTWQENRWPLIEKGMSRRDCLTWLENNGFPKPEKSSCIGCPYHSDSHWRTMRDSDPESWANAIEIDNAIRDGGTLKGMTDKQYMHRSLIPLEKVEFAADSQISLFNGYGNECEGYCFL